MNVIRILNLVTTVIATLTLVIRFSCADVPSFPPPESPLDCSFEDDFCGWHPAGTDYYQWLRRGYIGNFTKDLYSPTEGYLSYKYAYVDSNLCTYGRTTCQAALISVPIFLNTSSSSANINPVSSLSLNYINSSTTENATLANWCFEFYYFITSNQSSHQFDIDVFVDKPPDFSLSSGQHSVMVSENPEWTLSATTVDNPLALASGQWRHATVGLKLGTGVHQITLLSHISKSSAVYDSFQNNIAIAIDNSRLYKGYCVDLFEQDILTSAFPSEDIYADMIQGQVMNAAVLNDMNIWPRGIIPYAISSDFTTQEVETIRKSMNEFEKSTCIRFRIKTSETNYLDITKGSWCYSFAGRVLRPEKQPLALHSSCLNFGTVLHELNHAVGFYHEHSRYDRDNHVTIQWDNIAPGSSNQFQKYTLDQVDHIGLPYDYESVMHYSRTAYARLPGLTTIEPKENGAVIGQRERLSDLDVRKINKKYKCPDGTNPIDNPPTAISCTFDHDLCAWTQSDGAHTRWTMFDPSRAHFEAPVSSSNNGMSDIGRRSAVVDLTGAIGVARLTSPVIHTSGCFSFAFFFSRGGHKILRVVLIDNSTVETVVWQMENKGDSSLAVWRRGRFSSPMSNFRIAVEAEPVGAPGGSIAVDDFNFTSSHSDCAFVPTNARASKMPKFTNFSGPTVSSANTPSSYAFELNCTFERSDFCGWINIRQVDEFDWVLNSGRTLTAFTGPGYDHTLGESNPWGIYAYAKGNNKSPGNTARMVSPALTGYSSVCLRFWYHMYGNEMGTLRIYKRLIGSRNSGDVLSWEISGNQGISWQLGDVRMAGAPSEVFQLVFEAAVGQGSESDIAIDDIAVTFDDICAAAPSYVSPDTDDSRDDDYNNYRRPPLNRPHTTRSASLTSGQFLLPTSGRTTSLGRTFGRVSSFNLNPYGRPNRGRGTTNSLPSNQEVLNCNFDSSNTCSWVQDGSQDDFEWHINRGLTPSRNTGPMADRTTGSNTGYYLYLEASSPRRMGDLARLKSPLITNQPLSGCFHFWYSMYGSGIGELRVLTTSAADGSRRLLWRLVGEQGPDWLRGQVHIDLEPAGGKIFIEGIVGQSYLADIALDDFSFTGNYCGTIPQHAGMMPEDPSATSRASDEQRDAMMLPHGVSVDDAMEVPGSRNHVISSCSFKVGLSCSWNFMKDGDAYWYHSKTYPLQGTSSSRSSRFTDYIYILTDWLQPWRSVSLVSPFIDLDTPICVRLNYFMTSTSDSVSIMLKYEDGSQDTVVTVGSDTSLTSSTLLTKLSGPNDYPEWKQMLQTIYNRRSSSYKIVISLQHGHTWSGAIGVESAQLLAGSCP